MRTLQFCFLLFQRIRQSNFHSQPRRGKPLATDLRIKTARLISDFNAVLELANFIEHELEKRIIARHGLTKVESLLSIASTYKNDIKRSLPPDQKGKVSKLESMLATLRNDIDSGIRNIRNNMAGHLLQMHLSSIPENWLFMGHSTFSILSQDLGDIDNEFQLLDPLYTGAIVPPPIKSAFKVFWRRPDILGSPSSTRAISMQVGLWTPDVVAVLPSEATKLDDTSIRVLGLRLSIRQLGFIFLPYWVEGGTETIYERLLIEMSVNDYFSLEEAIFTGNNRSSTPSLVNVWAQSSPVHRGAALLQFLRAQIPATVNGWRSSVRNKITAHMDPDTPASDLETANWPLQVYDLNTETNRLCNILGAAARLDARTFAFINPALTIAANSQQSNTVPRWADT